MDSALRYAIFFPGQGAQSLGMAADLADSNPRARRVFDLAREILGWDVLEVCRSGPTEILDSTRVSQPAIFLHSMAVLESLGRGPFGADISAVAATAGLSLGEYSALVFAGALTFEEAISLVARRGELMQAACEAEAGTMAAVLGAKPDLVERVVAELGANGHRVGVANFNSPAETVISGTIADVEVASEALRIAGARRIVPLRVAGAYHSPLMQSAAQGMQPFLAAAKIRSPRWPFYANAVGARLTDPEEIRQGLMRQIAGSVRWSQSVSAMIADGVWTSKKALELGPGKVVQGLVRKIEADAEVLSCGRVEDLDKIGVLPL
jgi:[acyl-carrier-protein] S-malonyltransferase